MQNPHESDRLASGVAGARTVVAGIATVSICLFFFVACSKVPALPELDASDGQFSPALASAHYAQLQSLGPRATESEAESLARVYLARALKRSDARIERLAGFAGARHLLASLPGRSEDRVLVVVPWGEMGGQAGLDDAGAAIALELVRAASTRPEQPYGLVVAFADVRADERGEAPATGLSSLRGREEVRRAGEDLIQKLVETGRFQRVRGVLVLEPRADGPTRIARDLRSHPVFRSIFWQAADELGLAELFPDEATWSAPLGLQGALHTAGFGAVLALVDERAGEAAAAPRPAPGSGPGELTAPPLAEWAQVGLVADEGLSRLMRRLERVDAFAPRAAD